jgi:uncharacterized DUF497 family protein
LTKVYICCRYTSRAMTRNFDWDKEKNERLMAERGLSFEIIVAVIEQNGVLDDIENPSGNFPKHRVLVVSIDNYAVIVPYVMDGDTYFLKTAFQSRRATKLYLSGSRS